MASVESEESGELPDEPRVERARDKEPSVANVPLRKTDSLEENEKEQPPTKRTTASRWDADDDEEEEELADAKPVKSRWGDDDQVNGATLNDDERPEQGSDKAGAAREVAAIGEDGEKNPEADAPAADGQDAPTQAQESGVTRKSKRNMLFGCRSKDDFEHLRDIGQGTYGAVSKYRDKDTNEVMAMKRIKLDSAMFRREGFPMTSVREINILLTMDHPNIVNVSEVVTSKNKTGLMDVYMVMEYVQLDLKKFLDTYKAKLKIGEVKRIIMQLLKGIQYLHDNWVIHRDLKPANILYDHLGNVKICDFGMARHFGDPIPMMSPIVVTRNYRGPEIGMGVQDYLPALDVWSIGVIAAELVTQKVPFIESKSDIDLVNSIAKIIGSPHDRWEGLETLPNFHKLVLDKSLPDRLREKLGVQPEGALPMALDHSLTEAGGELIAQMLQWDPRQRISVADALNHPWFQEVPRPVEGCFMPQTHSTLHHANFSYD